MAKTFVLNDEQKLNSYGFRTLNSGINLERFTQNPVLLDEHVNMNQAVLGRWENVRIEGSLLLADAVFDQEDKQALKISGKVDRGFIKGCSMGLSFKDYSAFEQDPAGEWVLKTSELMEASICAIPSNANSVSLKCEGEVVEGKNLQVKLSENQNFKNKPEMQKLMLSATALLALGLSTADDLGAVALAVEKLATENKDLKDKMQSLNAEIEKAKKSKVESIVMSAIAAGKLAANQKESWVKLGMDNLEAVESAIESMPGKASLSTMVKGGKDGASEMTEEAFQKLSQEEQLAFKQEYPEEYAKLFANH